MKNIVYVLAILLFTPMNAFACQQGEFKVLLEELKPVKEKPQCISLRLRYPKKIGFFDDVQVKVMTAFSSSRLVSSFLSVLEDTRYPEENNSQFCMTEEAVKASSVTIKYTSHGGKIGAAVFCNEEIVIDDLAGLLAQGGKVYGRSDVQSK